MTSYLSRFNYQLNGPESGRKWVFLHGLMGFGSNWRKIVAFLEKTDQVLTFDQRGHGRSWKPDNGYAPEDYADDLLHIVKELRWKKFILVGHSMGGRNALAFAHRHAEFVERLVIEDIGPDSNRSAVDYYHRLLDSIPTPFQSKIAAKEFLLNEWPKKQAIYDNVLALAQYLYTNLEEKQDGLVTWRFSPQAIHASVLQGRANEAWQELRELSMPTLVIRGENSKELSREVYLKMIESNLNIQGTEISNAGHWVHSDQPTEFSHKLFEFANHS